MECAINRDRRIANIRVSEMAKDSSDVEQLIVHELLHPIFDPIREQADYLIAQLPAADQKQYKSRHDREVERAVEHLALCLYYLQSMGN